MSTRAVVVGGGVAGLAAAAAISRHVDEVVVLERDQAEGPRWGVAQADQLHNLLGRAQHDLERVLPGFGDALRTRGAEAADVAGQTHVWEFGVRMPLRSLGFAIVSARWSTVEQAVLDVLPSRVSIERGCGAEGLQVDAGRVTGVVTAACVVPADVVVLATGARSRCSAWLAELGEPRPRIDEMVVERWYVTVDVERPALAVDDPSFWLAFSTPPDRRGLLISPAGAGRWRVSASGGRDEHPPRDLAEVIEHAAAVADGKTAAVLSGARQAAPARLFRKAVVRWHRFDLMNVSTEGLWPVGDAVASLNPLLGQGISVAAWQAGLLADALPATAAEHHQRTVGPVRAAVDLTSLVDEPLAGPDGEMVDGLTHYTSVARAVERDAALHDLYSRMWHLLVPASRLRDPDVVRRTQAAAGFSKKVTSG